MSPKVFRWSLVPALVLAVLAAACSEQGALTEQLVGPDQASFSKGKANAPGQQKKGEVRVRGRNGHESTYYLVDGTGGLTATRRVYPGPHADVVEISIPNVGGLRVPVSAVDKPTDFTISTVRRVARDGTPYVAFDLKAVSADATKSDVGKNGFRTDVTLFLTKPSSIAAGSRATILWEVNPTTFKAVQCRSTGGVNAEGGACVTDTGSTLQARLRHFSLYVIGIE